MTRPVRLHLSRKKGFNLQALSLATNGLPAVKVSRPGSFGNPWTIAGARASGYTGTDAQIARMCVGFFREWTSGDPRSTTRMLLNGEEKLARLRDRLPNIAGKNLACWCGTHDCHADVLLELANDFRCEAV